jgi:methyl-accepting chemotaxis protein
MAGATGEITALLRQASEEMGELRRQTRQISDLSKVVKEIAFRVNLLALNAAIEAARAGEHGRGFAVVASEVRRLAEGTSRQAAQIDAVITQVVHQLEEANLHMGSGAERADQLSGQTSEATSSLAEINRMILEVAAPIEQLGTAVEEHAATVGQVSETVGVMAGQAEQINDQFRVVAAESQELLSQVQKTQQGLSTFYKGSYTDTLRRTTFALAADLGQVFEKAIAAGKVSLPDVLALEYTEIKGPLIQKLRHICDVSKVPVTGFSPPKYATRYDQTVDLALREVLDSYLGRHQNLLYTTILDLNAYSPISNTVTCRDWAGDLRTDSLNNRMKRFATDISQLDGARLGLKGPSYDAITAGLYVRNFRTVLTRSDLQAYGNSLRQADEPVGLSNCYTFASLSGKATSFCAVPVYVMGHRYGAALIGWDAGASAQLQPAGRSGT